LVQVASSGGGFDKVGRKQWKRESDYHRRSLAETTVFRFKTIFGDRLQTRQIDNQFKELMLKSFTSGIRLHRNE
jgi:hypothetical protein